VDALGALVDLAYVYDKGISEGILCRMVAPKLDKWLSKVSGREQRVFADRFGGVSYLTGCCEPMVEVGGVLIPASTQENINVIQGALDRLSWLNSSCVMVEGSGAVDKAECGNEKPYSGPNVTIDVRGLQAFEALKKINESVGVTADTDVIFDYRQLNDLVADKNNAAAIGAEIGAKITAQWKALFEAADKHVQYGMPLANDAVANVKMDVSVTLPADEIVPDHHIGNMVEVEKPTAYDSLIGSVGTVRVPESLASGGQLDAGRVSSLLGTYDAVIAATGKVVDSRYKPVSLPDVVVQPVRMLFSELALGARFRYIVGGKASSMVWLKLDDYSRTDRIGSIAEYDVNFIIHKNWVGQRVCCAADSVEEFDKLVVELVG
jgi:hypothetical protein